MSAVWTHILKFCMNVYTHPSTPWRVYDPASIPKPKKKFSSPSPPEARCANGLKQSKTRRYQTQLRGSLRRNKCCGLLLPFFQPSPPQKLLQGHGSAKTCAGKAWLEERRCHGKAKGRHRLGVMQKAEKLKQRLHGRDGLVACVNTSACEAALRAGWGVSPR